MGVFEVARKLGKVAASFIRPRTKPVATPETNTAPLECEYHKPSPSDFESDISAETGADPSGSTEIDGHWLDVEGYLLTVFGGACHAKQIKSLAYAVIGALQAPTYSISGIARGMAKARSVSLKHATKQVDRLLGNTKINLWDLFPYLVQDVTGCHDKIFVAMDWTKFEDKKDDQSTLMLSLVLNEGRSIPLIWQTFHQHELKDRMAEIEDCLLTRLKQCLRQGTDVTILADRGFGSQERFRFMDDLGFKYVIRFKGDTTVTAANGLSYPAKSWLGREPEKPVKLLHPTVTQDHQPVGAVICVHAKDMQDPWFLATSEADLEPQQIMDQYAMRWTIETSFRDIKDVRFGKGLSNVSTDNPERRDMLFFIIAITMLFLTLLGAASEQVGMDRILRANTKHTKRMHSLFTQGTMLMDMLATMRRTWRDPLVNAFRLLLFGESRWGDLFPA